jgi:hypothetical protein
MMRALLLACLVLPLSCWPQADTFSVMTYNLHQYALTDRAGGGEQDDPKPENARRAAVSLIAKEHPDVLAVQEMGNATVFAQFRDDLRAAGMDYPYAEPVDGVVRLAGAEAVQALPPAERLALAKHLLRDPVRAVRIEAAQVLAGVSPGLWAAGDRAALAAACSAFRPRLSKTLGRGRAYQFHALGGNAGERALRL